MGDDLQFVAECDRGLMLDGDRNGALSSSGVVKRYSSTPLQYTELFMWSNRSMSVTRTGYS